MRTVQSEFNAGEKDGRLAREAWENPNTPINIRCLIQDNIRKAQIGCKADEPLIRAGWLGWLSGWNVD